MEPTKQQMSDVLQALNDPKLRAAAQGKTNIKKAIPRVQGWIMDHMLADDRWLTAKEIAKATGKNVHTVRRGLQRLVLARFIDESDDGAVKVFKVANREAWLQLVGTAAFCGVDIAILRSRAEEAKAIVALAFRNGPIEDVHAGKQCSTCQGHEDYSRITQAEMRTIMKAAVDRVHNLLVKRDEDRDAYDREIGMGALFTRSWDEPEPIESWNSVSRKQERSE